MSDVAIKLDGVSKFYKLYNSPGDRLKEALNPFGKVYHKDFYALKNINLEIKKGEILGIVGKNGCGKSTLLKLIASILVPNQGEITVNGKISALLELGSGFNPDFTGLQNIFFYGAILGISSDSMKEKLGDIMAFAEIGDFINQPLKTYSSGMKSRLGFAVAVHIEPEILILDEVLSVGDVLFQRKCYAKMEEFFKGGKTILYVSHDANSINQLCTRAVLIDEGKIKMDADAKTVTTFYQKMLFSNNAPGAQKVPKGDTKNFAVPAFYEKIKDKAVIHKTHFIPGMISKSLVEYKNEDVLIKNARIVDDIGMTVNLLEFKEEYQFLVDVVFGVDAEKVAFGFEIKDVKGVGLATVESARMYNKGVCYTVKKGDVYSLKYSFKCIFSTGMYYINCGVSSFDGEQKVLNRIIDVLVFKTINDQGCSSGYVELVDNVEVDTGAVVEFIEMS